MTVNSDLSRVRYVANGQTTEFAVPFPYMTNNDGTAQLSVYLDDRDTPLLENKDYRVVGLGNYNQEVEQDDGLIVYEERYDSGTVIFYNAPEKGKPIAIIRNVSLTQGVQFINGEEFPAEDFSNALDKLTMAVQEVKENLDRAVMFPPTSEEKPTELRDNIVQTALEAKETADEAIAMVTETKETLEQGIAELQEETQKSVAMIEDKVAEASNQVDVFTENAISQVGTTVGVNVEKTRVWAEGEQTEVEELGGSLSSMGAADLAYAIANAPEDTPIDASGLFAMNVVKGEKGDKGNDGKDGIDGKDGAGVELGDIGFAPFGIDESKNLRRYLNGQVISQSQFESFTKKIKEAIAFNSNIATSETNWQAEVTNSPYGICGKFVIDDEVGTIRLPKYPDWSIREVGQAAVAGNGLALGLDEGDGYRFLVRSNPQYQQSLGVSNTLNGEAQTLGKLTTGDYLKTAGQWAVGVTADASKSGMIADLVNANTEDKLQGKWFIQVATGAEESVDVTREIELNNPFSLLDYKWSEYEINNASWLLSNGAFHSGATYVAVYDLLLKIHNGTETKEGVSVKLSTEAYTDTDFVINTADTTFRLPIKVKLASGNAVVGNGMTLGLTDGTDLSAMSHSTSGVWATYPSIYGENVGVVHTGNTSTSQGAYGVTTDPTKSGIETSSSGLKLYFYVGETIQDANVIVASGVLSAVAELKGYDYVVESYVKDSSWYRLYRSGWCEQGGVAKEANVAVTFLKEFRDTNYSILATSVNTTSVPSSDCYLIVREKLTTGVASMVGRTFPVTWEAKGYIRG